MKRLMRQMIIAFAVLSTVSFTAYCDMINAPIVPVGGKEKTAWIIGILVVLLLLLVFTVIRIRKSENKKRGWIALVCTIALGSATALGIAGYHHAHSKTIADPVDLRLEQVRPGLNIMIESAEDLVDLRRNNTVIVGTVVSVGELNESKTVTRQVGYRTWYQCCYVDAHVRVEPAGVFSGRDGLAGQEIIVRELLIINPDGTHEPSRLLNEDISRAVFCTNWFSADVFVLDIPEYDLIPVQDDGTITIWPYLVHAADYPTLDSFEAMARQQLGSAFGMDLDRIYRDATDEELELFRTVFEQPENNCYIRAKQDHTVDYQTAWHAEVIQALVEERFRSSDAVEEATEAQKQAYEAATGETVSSLWRMSRKAAKKLTDTSDVYPNWYWDSDSILVKLDSDPKYRYYVPCVEIEPIAPDWAQLSAEYGSVSVSVSLRYWTLDDMGEPVQYNLSFFWDWAEKELIQVSQNTRTNVLPASGS